MELDEVASRILRRHVRLIVASVVAGLLAVWLIHLDDRPQFEAVVRMVLDSPDPTNQSQAGVLADTARGIASGPSLLRSALEEVGATRDPVTFGQEHVDVRPLGSSGVLRLIVTDTDPRVAVEMSNAIAESVIEARSRVTDGTALGAVRALERQISTLDGQLIELDQRIDTLTPLTPRTLIDPHDTVQLRALERTRDALTRRLGQLQGELVAIQGQRALRPQAGVIDPATSALPLPSGQVPDYLLGGLLGLIVGVAAAAAREVVAPTVVGRAALARALGAPALAHLPGPPVSCGLDDVAEAARYVELAAVAADVVRVEVMSLEGAADVGDFVGILGENLTSTVVRRADTVGRQGRRHVPARDRRWLDAGSRSEHLALSARGGEVRRTGLVLVLPDVVRLSALEPARTLLSITGWPLLGIVAFRPAGRSLLLRRPRPGVRSRHWPHSARDGRVPEEMGEANASTAVNGR